MAENHENSARMIGNICDAIRDSVDFIPDISLTVVFGPIVSGRLRPSYWNRIVMRSIHGNS